MIKYIFKRTGRTHKSKRGFMKWDTREIVVADTLDYEHTLAGFKTEFLDYLESRYGKMPGPKTLLDNEKRRSAIYDAIDYTHTYYDSIMYDILHPRFKDAQRWTILMQLLSIFPAFWLARGEKKTYDEDLAESTAKILREIGESYGEKVYHFTIGKDARRYGDKVAWTPGDTPRHGFVLPPFERLKTDRELQERFLEAFAREHHITLPTQKRRLREHLARAIIAAEELAQFFGKDEKKRIDPEDFMEFKRLNEFLDKLFGDEFFNRPLPEEEVKKRAMEKRFWRLPPTVIAKTSGETSKEKGREPATPKKFPEVQKEVERELAAELLAIAKGLEFAGYSEDAMKKAEEELLKLIDELLENEANAFQVFHAVRLLRLVQKKDVEGIKGFKG